MSSPKNDRTEHTHDESNSNNSAEQSLAHYLEPRNKNQVPMFMSLLHLITCMFQLIQSIFLFAFSGHVGLRWMMYTNFPVSVSSDLAFNITGDNEHVYYARPISKFVGGYDVPWMTGAFILMSAVDHLFCILPWFRQHYEYYLERHQSPFRWLEYSFSSALMKVHIAQLSGVTDVHTLVCIFMLSHVAQYFCITHEWLNARARADGFKQNWFPMFFGTIPYTACWAIIFHYYTEMVNREQQRPELVFSTMISLFITEMAFPAMFLLQWKKIWIFEDYMLGEYGFIILSFIAKSVLAWTTLVGAEAHVDNWNVAADNVFIQNDY